MSCSLLSLSFTISLCEHAAPPLPQASGLHALYSLIPVNNTQVWYLIRFLQVSGDKLVLVPDMLGRNRASYFQVWRFGPNSTLEIESESSVYYDNAPSLLDQPDLLLRSNDTSLWPRNGHVIGIAWSPDASLIITSHAPGSFGESNGMIQLFDALNVEPLNSPDWVATTFPRQVFPWHYDNGFDQTFWRNVVNGQVQLQYPRLPSLKRLLRHQMCDHVPELRLPTGLCLDLPVTHMTFSPDGAHLVTVRRRAHLDHTILRVHELSVPRPYVPSEWQRIAPTGPVNVPELGFPYWTSAPYYRNIVIGRVESQNPSGLPPPPTPPCRSPPHQAPPHPYPLPLPWDGEG